MRLSWTSRFRIRRCVAGGALPCGCSVGAYEFRDGTNVWVIDEPDARCQRAAHRKNTVLDRVSPGSNGSPAHDVWVERSGVERAYTVTPYVGERRRPR